jgi:hypothetical protein
MKSNGIIEKVTLFVCFKNLIMYYDSRHTDILIAKKSETLSETSNSADAIMRRAIYFFQF